jgi:hypothetical protein
MELPSQVSIPQNSRLGAFFMTRSILASALALSFLSASSFGQFRTVTVQNSNSNPVPTAVQSMPPVTVSGTVDTTISNTPSVTIANTPSVNIANTPSVNATISGTPAVNATITGTPSVSITGTPTVSVTNLPTGTAGPAATTGILVKSLDNPAEQPYQQQLNCELATLHTTLCSATFVSPAGKMLVLEYVNLQADVATSGSNPNYFSLLVSANGANVTYYYPLGTQIVPGFFVSERPVKIYILPVSTVDFIGAADSNAGNVRFTGILSGHLVNVP